MPSAQPPSTPISVAIIGAGLAGVTLALTLHQHGIKSHIYELRDKDSPSIGGSISLQPNGLRVLDGIGIYKRVLPQSYPFEAIHLYNLDTGTVVEEGVGLEAAYGYKSLRVARKVLLDELRSAAAEREINIEYGFRFSHVVSDDKMEGIVTFASTDGMTRSAGLLIGADGIHSRVREHIACVTPEYTGMLGIGTVVPMAVLRSGEAKAQEQEEEQTRQPNKVDGYELPLNFRGRGGAVAMVPCSPDGSLVAVITGTKVADRSREEWEELYRDKTASRELFTKCLDNYPAMVRMAVEAADPAEYIYWPLHQMPQLDRWVSTEGRVAILGDAAHAVSPTTGQGSSQAFEDAYMMGLVLAKVQDEGDLDAALDFWQDQRQKRVFGMIDRYFGKQAGGKDPIELRSVKMGHESKETRGDAWLYGLDLEAMVGAWANGKC